VVVSPTVDTTRRAMSNAHSSARFPTTHWTMVVAAGDRASPEDRAALSELCRAYWYPLYVFVRRKGHDPDAAQDLTQAYFMRLMESGVLAAADRDKGRFRSFLRTDCAYFLADQRDRDHAQKRGGGVVPISIDARDAEGRYRVEPADVLTPERLFDRAWALTLLGRAVEQIASEYEESGRSALFNRLKFVLSEGPGTVAYASIAAELEMSEVAVQSAIQRLRKRFRALVRDQIAATLDNPAPTAIEDEIGALFTALGR
jgi:DNA-directed RNA polymerase specialized sigma24 family protein